MSSFLKYRFPGQAIVEKVGSFIPVEDLKMANGFIISDFLKENIYQFSERETPFSFEKKQLKPTSISKDEYLRVGSEVLQLLKKKEVEKVVFSRVKFIEQPFFDLCKAFEMLEKNYPTAFVYCFQDTALGTWLGASPEKLLSVENEKAQTVSLAGTREKASKKPWTKKECREQMIVTEFISKQLFSMGLSCIYTDFPEEEFAGPLRHLKTEISFDLQHRNVSDVLGVLHPTPAVCGVPKNKAIEIIKTTEAHDRELYSGLIGVLDEKKTCLYVNLRCSKWFGNEGFLFLGGGYTDESVPEKEWEETENKSKTLLNVLQTISFGQ